VNALQRRLEHMQPPVALAQCTGDPMRDRVDAGKRQATRLARRAGPEKQAWWVAGWGFRQAKLDKARRAPDGRFL